MTNYEIIDRLNKDTFMCGDLTIKKYQKEAIKPTDNTFRVIIKGKGKSKINNLFLWEVVDSLQNSSAWSFVD